MRIAHPDCSRPAAKKSWTLIVSALCALVSAGPASAVPPDPVLLMEQLKFSAKEQRAVREGEVVVRNLGKPVTDKEVAAVAVFKVPIPVDEIMDRFADGQSIRAGLHTRGLARLRIPPDGTGWEGVLCGAE